MTEYTQDWTGPLKETVANYLMHWRDRPCRYLELGVFEGRGGRHVMNTLLTHADSQYTGVDTWNQKRSNHVQRARAVANLGPTAELITGDSTEVMWGFLVADRKFDIIYVDAGHTFAQAFADACLAWSLLETGGVLFFDDFHHPKYPGVARAATGIERMFPNKTLFKTAAQIGFEKI